MENEPECVPFHWIICPTLLYIWFLFFSLALKFPTPWRKEKGYYIHDDDEPYYHNFIITVLFLIQSHYFALSVRPINNSINIPPHINHSVSWNTWVKLDLTPAPTSPSLSLSYYSIDLFSLITECWSKNTVVTDSVEEGRGCKKSGHMYTDEKWPYSIWC